MISYLEWNNKILCYCENVNIETMCSINNKICDYSTCPKINELK